MPNVKGCGKLDLEVFVLDKRRKNDGLFLAARLNSNEPFTSERVT
jgi:hypothetical protein